MLNSFLLLAEAVVYFSVMVTHPSPFGPGIGKARPFHAAVLDCGHPLAQKAGRASAPDVMPLIANPAE